MKHWPGPLIFLLFTIGFIEVGHAQELLYNDKEFTLTRNRWNSNGALRDSTHQIIADTTTAALYRRNDTLFVACKQGEELIEYSLFGWGYNGELKGLKVSNRGVVVIKSKYYDSHTGSAWSQWFESSTHLLIIDMVAGTVLFSGTTEYSYNETIFKYDGDISNDTLTAEEMTRIYEERTESVETCVYKYSFDIDESSLRITEVKQEGVGVPSSSFPDCKLPYLSGLYLLHNGAYVKATE